MDIIIIAQFNNLTFLPRSVHEAYQVLKAAKRGQPIKKKKKKKKEESDDEDWKDHYYWS